MADRTNVPKTYGREVRDTIVKSSLTGVAATVLAVTIFSPAGLGGLIGTSVASGLGLDANTASADDAYANLPAYPSPLTQDELTTIRSTLARTTASLEITRAATEDKIEQIRSIAVANDLTTFSQRTVSVAPVSVAPVDAPAVVAEPAAAIAPAPVAPAADPVVSIEPISYTGGGGPDLSVPNRDPNLELAALMFATDY